MKRDFLTQSNPVASALMAKMNMDAKERAKVKAECLRLLVTLKLDPARMQLISGFIDTYLTLNPSEERDFQQELNTFSQPTQEQVMQITTSWMRQGIEQGEKKLILRIIERKIGQIPPTIKTEINALNIEQIEALGEALLDFSNLDDLINWLNNESSSLKRNIDTLN